jgi:hypothetical protein
MLARAQHISDSSDSSSSCMESASSDARDTQAGCSDSQETGEVPIVLDVRNGYEWDVGHFVGAARPAEEEFRETPRGDDPDRCLPAPLCGVSKSKPVMVRFPLPKTPVLPATGGRT